MVASREPCGKASPAFFNLQRTFSFFYTGLFYPNTMLYWGGGLIFFTTLKKCQLIPCLQLFQYIHALCQRFAGVSVIRPSALGSAAFATQRLSTRPTFFFCWGIENQLYSALKSILQWPVRRHLHKPPARFLCSRNLLMKFSVVFPHHGDAHFCAALAGESVPGAVSLRGLP